LRAALLEAERQSGENEAIAQSELQERDRALEEERTTVNALRAEIEGQKARLAGIERDRDAHAVTLARVEQEAVDLPAALLEAERQSGENEATAQSELQERDRALEEERTTVNALRAEIEGQKARLAGIERDRDAHAVTLSPVTKDLRALRAALLEAERQSGE